MNEKQIKLVLSEHAEHMIPETTDIREKVYMALRKEDLPMKRRENVWKKLAVSAAVIAIIILTVTSVPPLRTLAQNVLTQIGLIQLIDEATIPEQQAGQVAVERIPNVTHSTILTIEESSAVANFPVYEPDYIPAGYTLSDRNVHTSESGIGIQVIASYTVILQESVDFISLTQWRFEDNQQQPLQWAIGSGTPIEVNINGQSGVYIEQAPTGSTVDEDNRYQIQGVNILSWEQDGFTFILQSFQIGLEELQRIANSLTP